jgi:Putative peptidoglycan binding domain
MNSALTKRTVLALALGLGAITAQASDCAFFHDTDPLAQRDEYGLLHQGRMVNSTDFAPRYHWRFNYYFKAPEQLIVQPGYVGAMQTALRRLGYYCGPIDGVFSPEVANAIARLQKNYSLRVTGTFTDPVRWALHLP